MKCSGFQPGHFNHQIISGMRIKLKEGNPMQVKPVRSLEYSRYFDDLTRKSLENPEADPTFKNEIDFFVDRLKRFAPGKDVLEIGCGTGRNLIFLARHGFECYGVDFDPLHIQVAEELAREYGMHNLVFSSAGIGEEVFGGRKYSAIVSSDLIEHLPQKELLCYFRQVNELLLPGGIFLIQSKPLKYTYLMQKKTIYLVIPFFFLPEKVFNGYLKLLDRAVPRIYRLFTKKNLQGTWMDKPPGHCNPPDDEIVRGQLEGSGYAVRELFTIHPGTHRLSRIFRRLIRSKKLDTSIFIFSEKREPVSQATNGLA